MLAAGVAYGGHMLVWNGNGLGYSTIHREAGKLHFLAYTTWSSGRQCFFSSRIISIMTPLPRQDWAAIGRSEEMAVLKERLFNSV